MIVAVVAVSVALVSWIRRRERLLDGMGRFLTLMSALLVIYAGIQITTGWLRGRQAIEQSALAARLAQPIPGPATVPAPKRDIYLIVLDEYANSSVLRERFGYDNRPFEDSLRALGFYIPPVVRSNYVHTLLSLPSMLNAAHLVELEKELGPETKHPAIAELHPGAQPRGRVPRAARLPLRLLPLAVVALDQRQRARGQSVQRLEGVRPHPLAHGRGAAADGARRQHSAVSRSGPRVGGGPCAPDAPRGRYAAAIGYRAGLRLRARHEAARLPMSSTPSARPSSADPRTTTWGPTSTR